MKHLTILVPDAQTSFNTFACIVGAYDIFNRANAFWKASGKEQLFKVELAGASEKAEAFMEDNFQEKISMEELSQKFAVGRRNFDRRFIKATGNTPVEYLQRIKIESAKKAFREVFRKITGMSPLGYRKKYSKETSAGY